tara:strand:- start:5341 stop:6195 length:855 start_codon:yes stop_codon:yes gene_type:complete
MIKFDDSQFEDIIPTAILTAYPRTFSNITYSKQIFEGIRTYYETIDENLIVDRLAVELEARSKLIDRLLAETGSTQIIEFASGFSSRGIAMAEFNPDIQYVEIDLPKMADVKRKVLGNITSIPHNLHIVGGNALRKADFDKVCDYFDADEQVTIVNEGLLRYLTFDEKAIVAKNIRTILEKFGGVWISGDGGTKAFRNNQNKAMPEINTTILHKTGRNTIGNAFESQDHFKKFFGELGFSVEFHSYTEIQDELTSPKALGLTQDEVRDKLLAYASAMVFRLKKA